MSTKLISVDRILGPDERIVPTLIHVDKIDLANRDVTGEFTWLRYVVTRKDGTTEPQSWRVLDSMDLLLSVTNESDVSDFLDHDLDVKGYK